MLVTFDIYQWQWQLVENQCGERIWMQGGSHAEKHSIRVVLHNIH